MFVGQEECKLIKQSRKEKTWEEIFKYLDNEYEIKTAVEKRKQVIYFLNYYLEV